MSKYLNRQELAAEVRRRFEETFERRHSRDHTNSLTYEEKKKNYPWLYREIYSYVYNEMRDKNRNEKRDFWLNEACNGAAKPLLEEYGLSLTCNNDVYFMDKTIMTRYFLENVVVPTLENKLGITGITIKSKPKPTSTNLLTWEDVEIKENKE